VVDGVHAVRTRMHRDGMHMLGLQLVRGRGACWVARVVVRVLRHARAAAQWARGGASAAADQQQDLA
jgi:hypothetical protein